MEKFPPITKLRPLKDESNLTILRVISKVNEDNQSADKAFNEFYFRYYRYVWNVAYRVSAKYSKDTTVAEDLFQEIFKRVYLKAELLIKGKSEDIADKTIKAWLGRIGNNCLMDYIRSNEIENERTDFIPEVHEGQVTVDDGDESLTTSQLKLEDAIDKLETKEKDILYLYIYNTEKKVRTKDLQALADKYSISTETVRKTYYRIIETLKKQMIK